MRTALCALAGLGLPLGFFMSRALRGGDGLWRRFLDSFEPIEEHPDVP